MEGVEGYFEGAETRREHNGRCYSAGAALTPVILGPLCGLGNVNRIRQRAGTAHIAGYLSKRFKTTGMPGYYQLLCLLKLKKPQSLNRHFVKLVQPFIPEGLKGPAVSFGGKTVCSTGKMGGYGEALNTAGARIAELGVTFARGSVFAKSNEAPAARAAGKAENIRLEERRAFTADGIGQLYGKEDMEGFTVHRGGTPENRRQESKHGRAALLHIRQRAGGGGTAAEGAVGMACRNHALAFRRTL
jgi:hypothetical protein